MNFIGIYSSYDRIIKEVSSYDNKIETERQDPRTNKHNYVLANQKNNNSQAENSTLYFNLTFIEIFDFIKWLYCCCW